MREAQQIMTVFGDFHLIKKVGQGAMATVYKARQRSFDRIVALKMLRDAIAENPKLVERFYREARIMGELHHPNIVQGYGVGEIDGVHYFAMEYVSGISLQRCLAKLVRLSVGDALFVTIECAKALGYAHAHGVIHRDIKPENILITKRGEVKVADLGMVKSLDEDMSLTQTGHAVGTPWYMPMEQARNAKAVDGRSDIYALGCTLYCMLTGRPPFVADNIVEIIKMKEIGTFPRARQHNNEVPERLDLVLGKMAAKLPEHRHATCEAVIRDLQQLGLANALLSFHRTVGRPPSGSSDEEPISDFIDPAEYERTQVMEPLDVWYLRGKSTEKKPVATYNTEQLASKVASGEVPPTSQVSRLPETGYRSLATYKEFESVALALASRAGVDRKSVRYRNLYKKIEAQESNKSSEQHELEQITRDATRTTMIVAGVIAGGVFQFLVLMALFDRLL